ncbi:MAG: tRNA pseudouridine(38-40) synthase TruA [Congregibacter sp.]
MSKLPKHKFDPAPLPAGARIALRIEYDGTPFSGWQAQPQLEHVRTVQSEVERALAAIADSPLRVHCAGRTDSGVHATAQWVHFDAPASRSLKAWVLGGNAQLPHTVRIADARLVTTEFHARHSAEARVYDYLFANTPTAPALLAGKALWVRPALDARRMHEAVQLLLGERDFSAFRAAACQSRTPMRCLMRAQVVRGGDFLRLTLVANAFLHHMVRNIVGSLVEVGIGERPVAWLGELLEGRDRTLAAATASPHGLYLTSVHYPSRFLIPDTAAPAFFPEHRAV